MESGGAADLSGLMPPALSALRPLTYVTPALGSSMAIEGCGMQNRLGVGWAHKPSARASACMVTHAATPCRMHARTAG